jgi:hypothetical protein
MNPSLRYPEFRSPQARCRSQESLSKPFLEEGHETFPVSMWERKNMLVFMLTSGLRVSA